MTEVWKDIKDFPNYEVSNMGRVRNKLTGNMIHQQVRKRGYVKVQLWRNGKDYTRDVHRLVAISFLGYKEGLEVNHIDGDKSNNRINNLEWCTRKENVQHSVKTGLFTPKAPEPQRTPIRIIETGEVFDSISDCAKSIDSSPINIANCLRDEIHDHHTAKGYHFEYVNRKPFLYDFQFDAVKKMSNGCILNGNVGSGKSRTGLYYYFSRCGGSIESKYNPMSNPKNLLIITTAMKRDRLEWNGELVPFLLSTNKKVNYYDNEVVIDSWNNIKKYTDLKGWFVIFDEDRVTGSGAWVKAFLKIAKNNEWIILSATPADTWMDFVPVFVANGFYKNRTEFINRHVQYSRFTKYPKVERYHDTGRLIRLRNKILIDMDFDRHTTRHHEDVWCSYDIQKYKAASKLRWDPFKDEPIRDAAGLCYVWRRIVNSDQSRQAALLEIFEKHPKMIVFYSFDYERDILLNLYYGENVEIAEWSGHAHQPMPTGDRWIYLVNYVAGSEGWNTISTDTIVFYSQTYSYKTYEQAQGRIDRLTTPFTDLWYYNLRSRSGIDLAIGRALAAKRNFNEGKFVKW